jgi:5-methylcytosine-specific restriction protein A
MLKSEALFINGVYESVLQEILAVQGELPEHLMYLQPYSGYAITKLKAAPPTVDEPVRLYVSTTDDLAMVSYQAEIVGWEDKRKLSQTKRDVLNRVIGALQPGEEGGLYNAAKEGKESVNLLYIRRLQKLDIPFRVSELTKTSNNEPYSENRSQSGGWSYVISKL